MRKIFHILILITIFNLNLYCNSYCTTTNDIKNKIEIIEQETNTYSGEQISLEERLKNAEIYVYGSSKKGNINERITALSKVLGLTGVINNSYNTEKEISEYEIENNEKSNYPSVNKMEREVFGTAYEKENIYKRLDRLEKKAFGQISKASLNERVNNLQEKLNNKYLASEKKTKPLYENENYNYYSPKEYRLDLSKIEKKLFKKSYANENLQNRLSRIEEKIFSQKFDYEDEQTRLERISALQQAAKSGAEYKINKFAKYAAAGAQIGGIILLILAMIL